MSRVHRVDPSQLEPVSKFVDFHYAPMSLVVPATSELRTPLPGRVWYDSAAECAIERNFSAREIPFADVMSRCIENPLLAREMYLFDDRRIYLDTSIEMEYSPHEALSAVSRRFSEAIAASTANPVDERHGGETVLISHHEGGSTWGHYLGQSLPRMLLFLSVFPEGKIAVPSWHATGAPGFGEALTYYDIPDERLVAIEPDTVYRFKRAILLDFLFNFEVAAPHPKVLPLLRRFSGVDTSAAARRRAAFIKRRAESHRAIANELAVDRVMAEYGIAVYGPAELTLTQQVDLWHSHDLVIATLGSDLTNIVYARPGTRVLVLSPHWFGDAYFFELSVAAGLEWHELRCGEMGTLHEEQNHSSFNIDVDLLSSVLASLLA